MVVAAGLFIMFRETRVRDDNEEGAEESKTTQ